MRQQNQQARHFATWYGTRTRTYDRAGNYSAGRGLHMVRAGKRASSAPGFQYPNVIVMIRFS